MATKTDTSKLLNNMHLSAAFGVTPMTLYLWRQGTPTKTPLPVAEVADVRGVWYKPAQVKQWAKANGVELRKDLAVVIADPKLQHGKAGPKPVTKKRTAAKVRH